jgi:hypothetical protein
VELVHGDNTVTVNRQIHGIAPRVVERQVEGCLKTWGVHLHRTTSNHVHNTDAITTGVDHQELAVGAKGGMGPPDSARGRLVHRHIRDHRLCARHRSHINCVHAAHRVDDIYHPRIPREDDVSGIPRGIASSGWAEGRSTPFSKQELLDGDTSPIGDEKGRVVG